MLLPPYASPEQQALKGYVDREVELGTWGWHREDAERYFLAGGGAAADFDAAWQQRLAERHAESAAIANGTFHFAGGAMLYLVAGRKPG
jgi:hypothetical protein